MIVPVVNSRQNITSFDVLTFLDGFFHDLSQDFCADRDVFVAERMGGGESGLCGGDWVGFGDPDFRGGAAAIEGDAGDEGGCAPVTGPASDRATDAIRASGHMAVSPDA